MSSGMGRILECINKSLNLFCANRPRPMMMDKPTTLVLAICCILFKFRPMSNCLFIKYIYIVRFWPDTNLY